MTARHIDEARSFVEKELRTWLSSEENASVRAVLADDIFGRLRVAYSPATEAAGTRFQTVEETIRAGVGPWWAGVLGVHEGSEQQAREFWERLWGDSKETGDFTRLRILERHRNHGAWFSSMEEPAWIADRGPAPSAPPIVVFYSFKGGVGRTTALASFALRRAQLGERIVVLDLDLEAPGVGVLLSADAKGSTAQWGLVDYLLESQVIDCPLSDYYHRVQRVELVGDVGGEILVVPAGKLDDSYLGKLARIDLEPSSEGGAAVLLSLLERLKEELKPNWILLDARTGLSEPAGALLSGIAHLHVLCGVASEQTWQGLRLTLVRLGASRVLARKPQGDCLLVQALVPADATAARLTKASFSDRALSEFSQSYYADELASEDQWDTSDLDSKDAPHVPICLSYDLRLAHFADLADVAPVLQASHEYQELHDRIAARFIAQ